MSLVSNFIGEISSFQFGGKPSITPNFDLNDQTFSELLAKQMSVKQEENLNNYMSLMGLPAGFDLQNLNSAESDNSINSVQPSSKTSDINSSEECVTNSEMLTFFTSLFDDKPGLADTSDKGLFNFERKLAANSYGKYAKDVITDVAEFVEDALKLT